MTQSAKLTKYPIFRETPGQGKGSLFGRELSVAWLVIRDNLPVGIFPASMFALAGGIYHGLTGVQIMASVATAVLIGPLLAYVHDCWNQAWSGDEDAINKPHRPIPAGLATGRGLVVRGAIGAIVLSGITLATDIWIWLVLWPINSIVQALFFSPKYYFIWKPVSNLFCQIVMLGFGWHLSGTIDTVGWTWIISLSLYFTLAFGIEDLRDIEGDHAIGRRTPVMVYGQAFIRVSFALLMILLPALLYFFFSPLSEASGWRTLFVSIVVGAVSWLAAARVLVTRSRSADRLTYQLFLLTWGLSFSSASLLLA